MAKVGREDFMEPSAGFCVGSTLLLELVAADKRPACWLPCPARGRTAHRHQQNIWRSAELLARCLTCPPTILLLLFFDSAVLDPVRDDWNPISTEGKPTWCSPQRDKLTTDWEVESLSSRIATTCTPVRPRRRHRLPPIAHAVMTTNTSSTLYPPANTGGRSGQQRGGR